MADALDEKLKRHLIQVLPKREQLPRTEREHLVRHLKGVLSTVGELLEQEILKP